MKTPPNPTPAELDLLRVLWKIGPCTVRELHEQFSREKQTGYTTVLKMLQIMTEKGLVTRDDSSRAHIYTAYNSEETSQRKMVSDLIDRAFGGAAQKLVLQALSTRKSSPEELNEIRQLLNQLEGERS